MRKEFFFLEHTGPWWLGVIAAVATAATPSSATTAERNGDAG